MIIVLNYKWYNVFRAISYQNVFVVNVWITKFTIWSKIFEGEVFRKTFHNEKIILSNASYTIDYILYDHYSV